jgi:hypothetical protein
MHALKAGAAFLDEFIRRLKHLSWRTLHLELDISKQAADRAGPISRFC